MRKTRNKSIQAPSVRPILLGKRNPRNRSERGAQMIELALVMPILFVFLAATVEFGMYYNTYITLSKATRLGARYLSGKKLVDSEKAKTTHLVVCGALSEAACSSGTEIIKGLGDSNVAIDYTAPDPDADFPDKITVRIQNYQYQPFFDLGKFVGGDSWQSVDVSPSTTMVFTIEN